MTNSTRRRERRRRRFYERLTLVRAVNLVALVALALTLAAALLEWLVEPQTFHGFGEASWWAIATISTTGYGDAVPHTVAGKVVAALAMINALALVPAVTAVVTAMLVRKREHRLGADDDHTELADIAERLDRLERLLLERAAEPVATELPRPRLLRDA